MSFDFIYFEFGIHGIGNVTGTDLESVACAHILYMYIIYFFIFFSRFKVNFCRSISEKKKFSPFFSCLNCMLVATVEDPVLFFRGIFKLFSELTYKGNFFSFLL